MAISPATNALQLLSRAINDVVSGFDGALVARYGGEEFVVILPGENETAALAMAERIRVAVRLTALDTLPNAPPRQDGQHRPGLLPARFGDKPGRRCSPAADAALYEAKKQGRNRICVHTGADPKLLKALP